MLRPFSLWLCWMLMACGLGLVARAQQPNTAPVARGMIKVAKIVGEVSVTDVSTSLKTKVALNSLVFEGQVVETGANSSVVLVLSNGAIVNLKADSRLEVSQFLQNPFGSAFKIRDAMREPSTSVTKLSLRKGEIVSQVKKLNREAGSSFTVETPVGAAGIRGTAFNLSYFPAASVGRFALSMAEGLIRFLPTGGRAVEVAAGRQLTFAAEIDARTGQPVSIPEMPQPTAVSGGDLAGLQQSLGEALGAAVSVEFAGSAGAPGQANNGGGVTPAPGAPAPTPEATPSVGESPTSALASPPATPPAQRTTPGDGE